MTTGQITTVVTDNNRAGRARSASTRPMPRVLRVVLMSFAVMAFMVGSATVIAAVEVVREGAIRVSVQEKSAGGQQFNLIFPAAFINLALGVTSLLAPDSMWGDARPELARFQPGIDAVARELESCPDTDLVSVQDGQETVLISLRGGALAIDVDDPTETVHISLPLSVIRSAAAVLPDAANGSKN